MCNVIFFREIYSRKYFYVTEMQTFRKRIPKTKCMYVIFSTWSVNQGIGSTLSVLPTKASKNTMFTKSSLVRTPRISKIAFWKKKHLLQLPGPPLVGKTDVGDLAVSTTKSPADQQ